MTNTDVSAHLIRAYEATDYWVLEPVPFTMKIGKSSMPLADLCRRFGSRSACVITAWNPRSEEHSDAENDAAQRRLIAELDKVGLRHFPAFGADPTEKWKGEASLLVLGAAQATVEEFGRRYGQNCIVWAGDDALPRLIFLR